MLIAVNAGSSSLKLAVFDQDAQARRFDGVVEEIGASARLRAGGAPTPVDAQDHQAALTLLLKAIADAGLAFDAVVGVGHRIVHGGAHFDAPVRLDHAVVRAIRAVSPFAPLHNPPALAAIDALRETAPDLPQVACFDTAFHARAPEVAVAYALPKDLRAAGYRRYGFHGLSYEGLMAALPTLLGAPAPRRVLALHLGNGASVCGVLDGVGVATSMGFSPLDGLTMGARSGALDPTVVLELARSLGVDEAERVLTRESGLKGLSGGLSDMRALEASGTSEAAFAIAHFCYWAARHSGSMIAAMGGVDLIAFTGGIGAHSAHVRDEILEHLAWTGAPSVVAPADEERVIAAAVARHLRASA